MADEELEAGEGGKKSPILAYILIGVGVIVALAITVLATMYFVGYFDPDSAERIEATVQQLEMDAEQARARAEELAKGPSKETLDSPEAALYLYGNRASVGANIAPEGDGSRSRSDSLR